MAFQFDLDLLCFLQVVNDDPSTLISADCNRVAVSAKRDGTQWYPSVDLFDFLAFHDVEELNLVVKTGRADKKIIHRRKCNTRASIGVRLESEPQRLDLLQVTCSAADQRLEIPDTDNTVLVGRRHYVSFSLTEFGHGKRGLLRLVPEDYFAGLRLTFSVQLVDYNFTVGAARADHVVIAIERNAFSRVVRVMVLFVYLNGSRPNVQDAH